MPNSNDNQDYKQDNLKEESKSTGKIKEGSASDENNFTSDDLKGKKVDADPEKESDKPADVDQTPN